MRTDDKTIIQFAPHPKNRPQLPQTYTMFKPASLSTHNQDAEDELKEVEPLIMGLSLPQTERTFTCSDWLIPTSTQCIV